MTKYFLLIVLFLPPVVFSQNPVPTPTVAATTSSATVTPRSQRANAFAVEISNAEFEALSNLEEQLGQAEASRQSEEKLNLARRMIDELYRKPTKQELSVIKIDIDLREKYADFLKMENTGLIRLLSDTGCTGNTKVVVATKNCLKNTMPGAGTSYSFRINNYRIPNLADLMLMQNAFTTTGDWMHGILVNLGNIPLENVHLQTDGVGFLNNFQPMEDFAVAKDFDTKLLSGIKDGEFIYSRAVSARDNQTYLLRSVAYRGNVSKSANGLVYNELDYDKRKDILVAFRVVRKHLDGSYTILWKRLALKDSPKLVAKK